MSTALFHHVCDSNPVCVNPTPRTYMTAGYVDRHAYEGVCDKTPPHDHDVVDGDMDYYRFDTRRARKRTRSGVYRDATGARPEGILDTSPSSESEQRNSSFRSTGPRYEERRQRRRLDRREVWVREGPLRRDICYQ